MRFAPAAALKFFRRRTRNLRSREPADLGTAFGMEASLEDGANELRRNGSYEVLESSQPGRAPTDSPLAWLSRRT